MRLGIVVQREVGCLLASDPRRTRRTFSSTTFVEGAAMAEDYGKLSREALARANEIAEKAISWGLVFTVVVIAMLKGMFR